MRLKFRPPKWVRVGLMLGLLAALFTLGTMEDAVAVSDVACAGPVVSQATYLQRWDRTNVTVDGPHLLMTNDLGIQVRLEVASIVDHTVSLVDCEGVGGNLWKPQRSQQGAWKRGTAWLHDSVMVRTVHAGHTQVVDPSSVTNPVWTNLMTADGSTVFGSARFAPTSVCRVHFLMTGTHSRPISLLLHGTFRQPLSTQWRPFEVSTAMADGVLHDLPAVVEGDLRGALAEVVMERRVGRMFDGIDFEDPAAIARQVLINLNHHATVRVVIQTSKNTTRRRGE